MVFLCAIVPEAGRSVVDARAANPDDPTFGAQALDEEGRLRPPSVETAEPFRPDGWPLGTPAAYICCREDRWASGHGRWQTCSSVRRQWMLHGSHSPFPSRPAVLADVLHRRANSELSAWA
ncbi:MAG TPA: hypothetical protein VLX59_03400 [Acidimicrobiales bacterium]|nr:hypothetical protein [Acidimicrobiales bacterium]